MISSRYLPLTCALVAIALIPTLIHSYSGEVSRDGRSAARIPRTLGSYDSTASGRHPTWGQRRFDSDDWTERIYRAGTREVRLTVVRTYDPKSVYHHPELAVAYGTGFRAAKVQQPASRRDLPVHVLEPAEGSNTYGLYVLHYDDRFVADPILFQVRTAGELLFTRRKPMTLFFTTEAVDGEPSLDELTSLRVLFEAIDAFTAQAPAAEAAAD